MTMSAVASRVSCAPSLSPPPRLRSKVLASLHILGRGNFFDDISDRTRMSEPTICRTFHQVCRCFASDLYAANVHLPRAAALNKAMQDYDLLGFTGAVGSTDVTHVKWDGCPYSQAREYSGEEGYPTIAYEVTVDHTGRVLAATKGFAGAQNDKTIIRYDEVVTTVREDPEYKDRKFVLFNADGTTTTVKGAYLIVDNGYHKWPILMEPTKTPLTVEDKWWSKALESVRKDVECCFGIQKGRFRNLKLPILYAKIEDIDNMFFTCVALHNMLHAFDGMDVFEDNVDWGHDDGLHDPDDFDPNLDESWVGSADIDDILPGDTREEHDSLKEKLVAHFAYRQKRHDIVWLRR